MKGVYVVVDTILLLYHTLNTIGGVHCSEFIGVATNSTCVHCSEFIGVATNNTRVLPIHRSGHKQYMCSPNS